jgi:large subunit ribosomal protein L4
MRAKVYNQQGETVGEIELPDSVFGVPWNADLVHQAFRVARARQRRVLAHTKGRGEVRGGGKKPWRQKGTGRARHGSIRSPLWRGGGVTHGPTKERKFALRLPDTMRRKAIAAVLSRKAREGAIVVMERIALEEGRTKRAAELLSHFREAAERRTSALVLLEEQDAMIQRAFRNIPAAKTTLAQDVNVHDLLKYKLVFLPRGAIGILEKTLSRR